MSLSRLCTLLSVFLLWKLPSIHVGAVKQPVENRALNEGMGGILKSVEEAWDSTARVSEASVETRCRKPARRLKKGSKSSKGMKGSKGEDTLQDPGTSKGSKSGKGKKGGKTPKKSKTGKGKKGGKSSKKSKSAKGDVPLCDDDLNREDTASPTPAPNLNREDTASPTPLPNNSEDIPTSNAPAPSPTPPDNNLRDCSAISAGTARTDGSNQSFSVTANLIVDGSVPIQTILSELRQILQREVAPALAGCPPNARRRWLQGGDDETNIVNVLFDAVEAIPDGKDFFQFVFMM
jgi:hypothetical protein